MTALSRLGTDSTAIRIVFWGIFAHSLDKDFFRDSVLLWEVEHAFISNIDHNEKYRELRPVLIGVASISSMGFLWGCRECHWGCHHL